MRVEKTKDYVIINNRAYNPITGLPVDNVDIASHAETTAPSAIGQSTPARGVAKPNIHRTVQHSQTLSRRYVKKPLTLETTSADQQQSMVATYSPMSLNQFTVKQAQPIQKFSQPAQVKVATQRADLPSQAHPVAQRATSHAKDASSLQRQRASQQQRQSLDNRVSQTQQQPAQTMQLKSSADIKNDAILAAMNREMTPPKKTRAKKQRSSGKWARFMSLSAASLAIVMLAGYFTYLNMPNLSLRMAAVQSGIDAKYPGYSPDGYALNGPINFKDGEVSMKFAYADNAHDFTLTQQKSSWDSTAVRQYVDSRSDNTSATQIDGLTIYTYEGNAAWVNGGILYTLSGDARLSNEQIQRIATSM